MRATGYRRTVPVIVRVTDINDNTPEFIRLPYRVTVPEVGLPCSLWHHECFYYMLR